jgi:4-hydroxybenzoate polyprenyltransferase
MQSYTGQSRLKLFLALSRTPHLMLDLASPGLAAILSLGAFPSPHVLILGVITAFSGYTAVYALNDIIDEQVDRELIQSSHPGASKPDLDSVLVRHPLARGMLGYREALFWTCAWGLIALTGAYILNPLCPLIFLTASLLEIMYCRLLKITYLRSFISGIVKTSGPIAAVFAVSREPSPVFLAMLFLWLFFWEIGGQNVPNDLSDIDADGKIRASTIPVSFGIDTSIGIIMASLAVAVITSICMFWVLPWQASLIYPAGALAAGIYFLLLPAYGLYRKKDPSEAFSLFNKASYYPLSMLAVTVLSWVA